MLPQIKKITTKSIYSTILCASLISTSFAATNISIPQETNTNPTTSTTEQHGVWNPHPIAVPWYAGATLGVGESSDSNIGIAGGVEAGYALNSNIAAEFNFLRVPYINKKSNYLFAGNAVISLPLAGSLLGFGKIGLGAMKSPDKSRLALLMGGGVHYYLPSNLCVGAELLGTVGAHSAQSFSILGSASYYFGRPI